MDGSDPYEKDELSSTSGMRLDATQMLDWDLLVFEFFKKRHIPSAWVTAGGYGDSSHEVYEYFFWRFNRQEGNNMSEKIMVSESRVPGVWRIMFVCAGNICRSPLAHAVLEKEIATRNSKNAYVVESSGTNSYHTGQFPDPRMRETGRSHGVVLDHRSRSFPPRDLLEFDLILVMDKENYANVIRYTQTTDDTNRVMLYRTFDPECQGSAKDVRGHSLDVPDPWYGGQDGFEEVFAIVERTTRVLVDVLEG